MLSLLVTYLLCLFLLFVWQRKLIYFPEKLSLSEQKILARQSKLTLWPDADHYHALISQDSKAGSKGTIIVFHGNAGSANSRIQYINALEPLGYRVILAEYPGYAARPGTCTAQALIQDGIATTKQVYAEFSSPIFLWGESLGSGIVSGIVQSGQTPIKGITLITPFDSLGNVAQHHYWFFLAKWLLKDKFNNIVNLQNYTGKIAILQAGQDEIVPKRLTENLYRALPSNKKLWQFKTAGHNSLPWGTEHPWWHEVMQFLQTERDEV